jgi:HNH endonuclease
MVDNVHGKVFSGFGRCIYCGATGELNDEHIVPLSLGGTAVIEKASCGACEKITSYLDGYLARDIFNEYRSHVGMRTRRPKSRPKTLFASFRRPDGTEVVREFSPKEQPYVLVMPIWNVPGIALSKQPTPDFETTQGHLYIFASNDVQKWIAVEGLKLGVWPYVNYPTFARAIARISFCQAVARFGLDGFNHLDLPALILGTYPNISHYVGVTRDIPPPPDDRHVTHKVEIQPYNVGTQQYWLVSLRLFAHSGYKENGMPIYRTIVGSPKQPSPTSR